MKLKRLKKKNDNVYIIEYNEIKNRMVSDISKMFLNSKKDVVLITKEKKPYYIITQTDLIDVLVSHFDNMKIQEYIDKFPKKLLTINENETVFEAYRLLRNYKIHYLITVDDNGIFKYLINFYDFASFLTEIALKDDLTGLYNKRFFEFMIDKYKNEDIELGVVFIDLDNFKPINDNYGHLFGDKVLKVVSDKIKKSLRDIDYGFRFGGDEFVIMIFCDYEKLGIVAKRIKNSINSCKIDNVEIKCSIGYAHFPTDSDSMEEVIKLADNRMYEEKKKKK